MFVFWLPRPTKKGKESFFFVGAGAEGRGVGVYLRLVRLQNKGILHAHLKKLGIQSKEGRLDNKLKCDPQ